MLLRMFLRMMLLILLLTLVPLLTLVRLLLVMWMRRGRALGESILRSWTLLPLSLNQLSHRLWLRIELVSRMLPALFLRSWSVCTERLAIPHVGIGRHWQPALLVVSPVMDTATDVVKPVG